METPEDRLAKLGITLPPHSPGNTRFALCVQDGQLLYLSGHGPEDHDGNLLCRGRVGAEVTVAEAVEAARATGIQLLRTMREHLGSLERVERILKALVFVNSADDFFDQPVVADGFTDLMRQVFDENGVHTRSAIGTNQLPRNQSVEIEVLARVRPDGSTPDSA